MFRSIFKSLKTARMVEIRREGLRKFYRLADGSVFEIWRAIRTFGEEQLAEVDRIVNSFFSDREKLEPLSAEQLRPADRRWRCHGVGCAT